MWSESYWFIHFQSEIFLRGNTYSVTFHESKNKFFFSFWKKSLIQIQCLTLFENYIYKQFQMHRAHENLCAPQGRRDMSAKSRPWYPIRRNYKPTHGNKKGQRTRGRTGVGDRDARKFLYGDYGGGALLHLLFPQVARAHYSWGGSLSLSFSLSLSLSPPPSYSFFSIFGSMSAPGRKRPDV